MGLKAKSPAFTGPFIISKCYRFTILSVLLTDWQVAETV